MTWVAHCGGSEHARSLCSDPSRKKSTQNTGGAKRAGGPTTFGIGIGKERAGPYKQTLTTARKLQRAFKEKGPEPLVSIKLRPKHRDLLVGIPTKAFALTPSKKAGAPMM